MSEYFDPSTTSALAVLRDLVENPPPEMLLTHVEAVKVVLNLAEQALHSHNAVAHFAETQSAKDQAVAMCNKFNLEKMLIEFFGQDRVKSEPPTLVETEFAVARLIDYKIDEVYFLCGCDDLEPVDEEGNGEIEVAIMPFRWREKTKQ